MFDLIDYLRRQQLFPSAALAIVAIGICDHIKKELVEIQEAPWDLKEWIDVVTLARIRRRRADERLEQIVAQLDCPGIVTATGRIANGEP